MANAVRMRIARRSLSLVLTLVPAIGLGSCGDLLGPTEPGSLYVLTTIADRPSPVANLMLLLHAPYEDLGSYSFIVAESVTFFVGGRGKKSTTHRHREFAPPPATSEPERRYTDHWEFRYWWDGPQLVLKLDDCHTVCDSTCREHCHGIDTYSSLTRGRWGSLEAHSMTWNGRLRWHYELVSGAAP